MSKGSCKVEELAPPEEMAPIPDGENFKATGELPLPEKTF
jgi:hypothetical protein